MYKAPEDLIRLILLCEALSSLSDEDLVRVIEYAQNLGSPVQEDELLRQINGALRNCINDHGPITREFIGSAGKRLLGHFRDRFIIIRKKP